MRILRGFLMLLGLVLAQTMSAQTPPRDRLSAEIERLTKEMYRLYSTDSVDRLIEVTEELKSVALKAGNEVVFYKAWNNQASHISIRRNREEGLAITLAAREYAQAHSSKYGLYTCTQIGAQIQSGMGLNIQAEKAYRESIHYRDEYFPEESAAFSYLGLAKIYQNRHQPDKIIEVAEKALAEPGIIPIHEVKARGYICVALDDLISSNIDVAANKLRFEQAYKDYQEVKSRLSEHDSMEEIVEYYNAKIHGDREKALYWAKRIRTKTNRLIYTANAYAGRGYYDSAYFAYGVYKKYSDSLNNAEAQRMATEHGVYLNLARAELEAEKNANYARTVFIVMAALIIVFLCYYLYRARKYARELRGAYDRLEETTSAKERIESELRIARNIQLGMVPSVFPAFPERREIDLFAQMIPAKAVGGDLYDFFLLPDASAKLLGNDSDSGGKLYFCLGDVAGKGVPASMTMAVAVNLFRSTAKEGFPPSYVATKLNDVLSADNDSGMFVTMFIGMIDLQTGRMDYCNAGHNPPVIIDRPLAPGMPQRAGFLEVETNVPIGLWKNYEFVGESIENVKNRTLFIYTDGVNEAENHAQEQYGEGRLLQVLSEARQPLGENVLKSYSHYMVERVRQSVSAFVGEAEQSDDMTMLCLKIGYAESHRSHGIQIQKVEPQS